jgi:diguanylate cyclase (GGDEF)-like protein
MNVLVVDDSIEACQSLKTILEAAGYGPVHVAYSTADAFRLLGMAPGGESPGRPAAILLDLCIPPVDGVQSCRLIKEREEFKDVPVIMMTGWDTSGQLQAAFAAGASDYLTKPIDPPELLARLHAAVNITQELRRRSDRVQRLVEIQRQTSAELDALRCLACQDDLTGTANRRHFNDTLRQEWARGARDGLPLGLLMVDIDHFKTFNDTYGHPLGDLCLRQVADAMRSAPRRAGDLLARYGGEEFAIMLPNTPLTGAVAVAEAIIRQMAETALAHAGSPTGYVTLSIGAASMIPSGSGEPADLVQAADSALYAAKRNGRNRVCHAADAVPGSQAAAWESIRPTNRADGSAVVTPRLATA